MGVTQFTLPAVENDRVNPGVKRAKVVTCGLYCQPALPVFPGQDVGDESATSGHRTRRMGGDRMFRPGQIVPSCDLL